MNPIFFPLAGCPLQVLQQLIKGFGYFGKVWNKPPVVAHKTQEGPNFSHSRGAVAHSATALIFSGSVETTFLAHHMSQVVDLLFKQITLGKFRPAAFNLLKIALSL